MKQVVQSARDGKLSVRDVPAPETPSKGCLLVRTRASLISAGTERLVTQFAKKSLAGKARARPDLVKKVLAKAKRDGIQATLQAVLSRLDEPLPLGYSAAGVVIAVGAGLEGRYRVGDRVAIAGAGLANHADVNVVPESLAAPIPEGVDFGEAAFGTVASIAMHGLRTLGCGLGDVVVVLGAGLVGLLATRLAVLAGSRVVALDYDPKRLEMARKLGAEVALNLAEPGAAEKVKALNGIGADGILIAAATDSDEPFQTAADVARDRARVCLLGMTGTRFSFRDYMQKELTIVVSRSYGPGRYDPDFESRGVKYPEGFVRWTETANLADCLRLMAPMLERGGREGRLDVAPLITHRFPIARAEDAYVLVTEAKEPHLGVLLDYDEARPKAAASFPAAKPAAGGCVLGVIGAGNFARSVLLPALKKSGAELRTLATHRPAQAEQYAREFGFKNGVTEAEAIFADPAIDAVVIATRHNSHAELTARALAAGKSVLVEKPLGLSREEIGSVAAARQKSTGFFQVGFNRRFAPQARALRDHLAKTSGPTFLVLRINAGALESTSWIVDPSEGGGRILGEMCHFIDLARFLVGAAIVSVQADATRGEAKTCQDATVSLRFADGSLATVAYTALGDASASKERIEAYAGGSVAVLEDFRSLSIVAGGKTLLNATGRGQDKGFAGQLEAFTAAVRKGGSAPTDEAELIETSLATIAVLESLRVGGRIDL
jgi:predicted dehydrogenase/threonine dehydrogenase-like Zn-dependent dehydrogenase